MKKSYSIIFKCIAIMLILVGFTACSSDEKEFNKEDLYGTWKEGTLHDKYFSDGNGKTWDTADDVSEEEAQSFRWTLEQDRLTQFHKLEMSDVEIPQVYTVTTLTNSILIFKDGAGKSHTFTKVN